MSAAKVAVVGYGAVGMRLADGAAKQGDMELVGIVDVAPTEVRQSPVCRNVRDPTRQIWESSPAQGCRLTVSPGKPPPGTVRQSSSSGAGGTVSCSAIAPPTTCMSP